MLALTTGTVLLEESQYLTGNRSLPTSSSVLESGTISPSKCIGYVRVYVRVARIKSSTRSELYINFQ